ncbi:hypothetical protein SDC9_123056 [bioreactor metagenome]|uniref:Uncharacterized protein n=1 Tax=bioreactor metagenome TaxID=1076179 RepID=A0A645CGL7_9ZZZZ
MELLFHEGALDNEVAGRGGIAFLETALFQQFLEFGQHSGAAAQHDAIGLGIQIGQTQILREGAVVDLGRDTALIAEGLACHRGVVMQLALDDIAEEFMLGQFLLEQLLIGQLLHLTHAMHHNHVVETLIGLGVARHGQPGSQAGTRTDQIQILAGQQIVDQQRARGLLAHDDGVTHLDVLQLGGQRAFGYLDRQELQMLFVVGTGDGVGAQQVLAIHLQADHGEVAVGKAQRCVAGGGEGEKTVGPVVDGQHAFFKKSTHDSSEIKTRSRKPARQMLGGGGALQVRAASALAAGCQAGQDLYCPAIAQKRVNHT